MINREFFVETSPKLMLIQKISGRLFHALSNPQNRLSIYLTSKKIWTSLIQNDESKSLLKDIFKVCGKVSMYVGDGNP